MVRFRFYSSVARLISVPALQRPRSKEPRFLEDPVLQADKGVLEDTAPQPHQLGRCARVLALQHRLVQVPRDEVLRTGRAAGLQDTSAAVADFGGVQDSVLARLQLLALQRLAGRTAQRVTAFIVVEGRAAGERAFALVVGPDSHRARSPLGQCPQLTLRALSSSNP
jgi:hypothetical protein